jgi:hypothetical protein
LSCVSGELRSIYRFYSRQSAAGASQRPSGHSAAFHTAAAAIKAVHEHLGYMSSNNNNSDNQTAELSAHEIRASRLAQQAQLTLRLRGLWAMARDCQLLNSTLSLAKFNELIHPPRKVYPADATAKQIRAAASAAVLSSALQQQQQQQEVTPTKTKPNSKPGTADKIAASANRSGATTPLVCYSSYVYHLCCWVFTVVGYTAPAQCGRFAYQSGRSASEFVAAAVRGGLAAAGVPREHSRRR